MREDSSAESYIMAAPELLKGPKECEAWYAVILIHMTSETFRIPCSFMQVQFPRSHLL
jgi:hypothetical protein